jgi:prefoldin subunit 5
MMHATIAPTLAQITAALTAEAAKSTYKNAQDELKNFLSQMHTEKFREELAVVVKNKSNWRFQLDCAAAIERIRHGRSKLQQEQERAHKRLTQRAV